MLRHQQGAPLQMPHLYRTRANSSAGWQVPARRSHDRLEHLRNVDLSQQGDGQFPPAAEEAGACRRRAGRGGRVPRSPVDRRIVGASSFSLGPSGTGAGSRARQRKVNHIFPQFQQRCLAPSQGVAGCATCVTQSSPASSSLLSASSFLDALPFAKRGAFLMVGEKEK